ncbi:TVP38/TMEM64 family protein [Granulibacter bethesdensis]|uniref:TVP38/TMEM64 family protein n=1 Tax=Granulibacter bethesdensis TaxID=364410 RepID=UPI0003F1CCC6|nr:VTT domain-containing protein [Granulibacter bethesdensis]AHJ67765.1 putative membrane associated protein [Granulibacter bethesdensis]
MKHALAVLHSWLDQALPWADQHPVLTFTLYMLAYALSVLLLLPGGLFLGLAGGALCGTLAGSISAIAGATLGAAAFHYLTRRYMLTRLRCWLPAHCLHRLDQIAPQIQRDGFNYMLAARLMPMVPFWLSTLAAPFASHRIVPFAIATAIGSAPLISITVSLGAGLRQSIQQSLAPTDALMSPSVLVPLFILALLSLVPVALRHAKAKFNRA